MKPEGNVPEPSEGWQGRTDMLALVLKLHLAPDGADGAIVTEEEVRKATHHDQAGSSREGASCEPENLCLLCRGQEM